MSAVDDPCPICGTRAETRTDGDATSYICGRCGTFELSSTAEAVLSAKQYGRNTVANLSGWIREHPNARISSRELESLSQLRTPTVAERAMKLLKGIAQRYPVTGAKFNLDFDKIEAAQPWWLAMSWSGSKHEVQYLLDNYLHETVAAISGNFRGKLAMKFLADGQITPHGHELIEQMREGNRESAIGFCAMWFADDLKPLWTDAIEPAIKDAGYDPIRIDQHEHVNRIDDEIVAVIRKSKFVVADFTGQRGGVYFESGFALGLGLRVIWLCRDDQLVDTHFDTRQYNFLKWKTGEYVDLRKRIQNRIEATLGRGPI
jgi:hypothetical protein